jgi:DNA-binding PadR family transcriptional regulator
MSSIRLFVLGSLAERGEMHGHAMKLLAEEEHIDNWADVAASAIYGVIKRLASEGLIAVTRTEREGNYPERQVYDITDDGRAALDRFRREGLEELVMRPDPVDLALARLDPDKLDELPAVIQKRLAALRVNLDEHEAKLERIRHWLTVTERVVMRHSLARLRGEIVWHNELLEALPEIIRDEKQRGEQHGAPTKGLPS